MSPHLSRFFTALACAASLLFTACEKKERSAGAPATAASAATPAPPKPATVDVVPETERSKSFLAVTRQLELGGTLYGYVDIDGDAEKLARNLNQLFGDMAKAQPALAKAAAQDFPRLAAKLGLTDVKAIGLSSVPDGTGYFRNRVFFYTPGERHGLLAGLGGKPGPFTLLPLAPADTTVYAEADLDVASVYQTIRDVVQEIGGETAGNKLEAGLRRASEQAKISLLDLIYGLKGHSAIVLRMDPAQTIRLPGAKPFTVPYFSLLACVENIGPVIEDALANPQVFRRSEEGGRHVYTLVQTLPVADWAPTFVIDGRTLYFATSRAFYDECRAAKSALATSPGFQQALAHVGTEGNGLSYVRPEFFQQLHRIPELNAGLPATDRAMLDFAMSRLPTPDQPLIGVRTNLPDGVLVRSYLNRSLKQDAAMVAVYNPVTIGMLSAMAIPAFQKVRASSQEKAVLNNLRQLSAAADQYYLENGVSSATFDQLVGPGRYIKRIQPVVGEDYRSLHFSAGEPLHVRLPDGRVIRYGP